MTVVPGFCGEKPDPRKAAPPGGYKKTQGTMAPPHKPKWGAG
ncbi:hypothetical protein M2401_006493, partial [Pseudomonas sp. JUb42]|nr:hypothetical protein [Pseudomonas sp. JUb42]